MDGLGDQVQLLTHGLIPVRQPDVRNIGAPDVVALLPLLNVVRAQPVAFYLSRRGTMRNVDTPGETLWPGKSQRTN